MKLHFAARRASQRILCWSFVLGSGLGAWAVPAIQSLDVQPSPLQTGGGFTIAVAATDVTQATATVDFRPWATSVLRVTLSLQGGVWRGSGIVPGSLQPPAGSQATVKVLALNPARQRADRSAKPST